MSSHNLLNRQPAVRRLILGLLAAAAIVTALRLLIINTTQVNQRSEVWDVTFTLRVHVAEDNAKVRVAIPLRTMHVRLVGQNITHPGWRIRMRQGNETGDRLVAATALRKGKLDLAIEYSLLLMPTKVPPTGEEPEESVLSDEELTRLLAIEGVDTDRIGVWNETVNRIIEASKNEDQVITALFRFASRQPVPKLPELNTTLGTSAAWKDGNALRRAHTLVLFARMAEIPARLVAGVDLSESDNARIHFWTEIFEKGNWSAYDPTRGLKGVLPTNMVPLRTGYTAPILIDKARIDRIRVTTRQQPRGYAGYMATPSHLASVLDLSRLSFDDQRALMLLLLLPFGVLLTALFRQILKIRTYGTFTPTLLGLAALFLEPLAALITFGVIIVAGISARFVLGNQPLSRFYRLALLFTVVAGVMALLTSLLKYYGILEDGGRILLPIVVLASLIDRIYSVMDENGTRIAMTRLGWTLIVAIGCFGVLLLNTVAGWVLRFPEIHFITLAAILWLGTLSEPKAQTQPNTAVNGNPQSAEGLSPELDSTDPTKSSV